MCSYELWRYALTPHPPHQFCHFAAAGFGLRHLQVLLLFTGLLLAYGLRVNMSIGIVAMVDNTSNPDFEVTQAHGANGVNHS